MDVQEAQARLESRRAAISNNLPFAPESCNSGQMARPVADFSGRDPFENCDAPPDCPQELTKQVEILNLNSKSGARDVQAAESVIARADIPRRFADAELGALTDVAGNRAAIKAARIFARSAGDNMTAGRGLLIVGAIGCGKTALAVATAKAAIRQVCRLPKVKFSAEYRRNIGGAGEWFIHESVGDKSSPPRLKFIQTARWLESLREKIGEAGRDRVGVEPGTRLVVLDDIGAERPNDWTRERLFLLVNELYERKISIIATSNLGLTAIAEAAGLRTADRLAEMCGIVAMENKSWRRS